MSRRDGRSGKSITIKKKKNHDIKIYYALGKIVGEERI